MKYFGILLAVLVSVSSVSQAAYDAPKAPVRTIETDCRYGSYELEILRFDYRVFKVICSSEDLFAINVTEESLAGNYILGTDLDLSPPADPDFLLYKSVGTGSFQGAGNQPFTGHFIGNGHRISNFEFIDSKAYFVGLFGATESAYISDLYLDNFELDGRAYTGSLIGKAVETRVERIVVTNAYVSGHRVQGLVVGANMLNFQEQKELSGLVSSLEEKDYAYGIFDVLAIGTLDGRGTHTGGITGINHHKVENVEVMVQFTRSESAQGRVVGYNMHQVSNAHFFPLAYEYVELGEKPDTEIGYWEYVLGLSDEFAACGNNSYDKKNRCRNASNQMMSLEEVRDFKEKTGFVLQKPQQTRWQNYLERLGFDN